MEWLVLRDVYWRTPVWKEPRQRNWAPCTHRVSCSVLQCSVVRCNVLQWVAVRCQRVASALQWNAVECSALQRAAGCCWRWLCCSVLQSFVACCIALQCVTLCCGDLQCIQVVVWQWNRAPCTCRHCLCLQHTVIHLVQHCVAILSCSVLQHAADSCALQCVVVHSFALYLPVRFFNAHRHVAAWCSVLQYVAMCCRVLPHGELGCRVLQPTALQHPCCAA